MANDNRSSRRTKNDEDNAVKKRPVNGKGSSSLGTPNADTSGLRRSTRETSSRKQSTPSPSSTRKSERLEKRIPTPPAKKNHEKVEKQRMPSPMRRSDRGKKQSRSSSSGSKKSEKGSLASEIKLKKLKRRKSVKQLTYEARETNRSKIQDVKSVATKNKRMDARTYKALFKQQQRKDTLKDVETARPDKLSQVDSSNSEGSGSKQVEDVVDRSSKKMGEELTEEYVEKTCEGDSERSNSSLKSFDAKISGNLGEVDFCGSSQKKIYKDPHESPGEGGFVGNKKSGGVKETLEVAQRLEGHAVNNVKAAKLIDHTSNEESASGDIDLCSNEKVILSKRKRNMDRDPNASVPANETCTSINDAVSSPSNASERQNSFGTCNAACFKRQRVGNDLTKHEFCSCNATLSKDSSDNVIPEDRGEYEESVNARLADSCDANVQQKEIPLEMDNQQDTCIICNLGGKLLCCDGKGCKTRYHISCVNPPQYDATLGGWHCLLCVKKIINCGVHSVSEGFESIWDVRDMEVSDAKGGLQMEKQYLVKFKGLAHIHNQWIPESQLHLEAPSLVSEFYHKKQSTSWKQEWTVPHRLLKKRILSSKVPNGDDRGDTSDNSECTFEWLVKWRGLGYEHATWELENASFLCSAHAQSLKKDYQNRREKARRDTVVSLPDKNKKDIPVKLSKLPVGVSSGLDYNNLSSVNKLREFWHKGQNAVIIDDQERMVKIVLYIMSLLRNGCQPFLIISTSSSVSLWEAEFSRLAPSVNVVVYCGNKDVRKNIRTLEFYEEGGSTMFQVLISPLEAVIEDLEMLECLRWEAIIVDECQCSEISMHFEQIKMLVADVWALVFVGQIKDTIAEHLNLLSLLDSHGDLDNSDDSKSDSLDNLSKLKRRLTRYVAYDCKLESSRFVEYWVPVSISNVQLEQYCATLLSNSYSLCSTSKVDLVGALRDILISTRKCCDHPYIVDPSLQGLITRGLPLVEYLDVGIKASGKLQLLDTILSETKNRQLRAVILFQSTGGSGRDSIGDILDDLLRQRFGPDSYERVDGGLVPSKKQAAMNNFNRKDSGRFVFLLENRACLPSIKLSSVDLIVIFDSDWNPLNDLRALHKISLGTQFDHIKVFRLYSSCTVEEKVLILAKNDLTVDSNLLGISRSTSHALLMWGAAYLFKKLDDFHGGDNAGSNANISYDQSLLKDVVKEFLSIVSQNSEDDVARNSKILKVQQSGGTYSRNSLLLGEQTMQLPDGEPHIFWTKLLEGRNPRWKYISGPSQRNRKRVQYFDHQTHKPEGEMEELGKKRRKVGNDNSTPTSLKRGPGEGELVTENGGALGIQGDNGSHSFSRSTASVTDAPHANQASTSHLSYSNSRSLPEVHMVESEDRTVDNTQKRLHLSLKPEISRLCEILQLSEDVKDMVGRFLEYVIYNHQVSSEPATILQAFEISLCWTAASLLKQKIDRKESLVLAKQHLNFDCKEEEVNNVYSKLRELKKIFLSRTEQLRELNHSNKFVSAVEDNVEDPVTATTQFVASCTKYVKLETEERFHNQEYADQQVSSEQERVPNCRIEEKDISKKIKHVQKICRKRMDKLMQKQREEIEEVNRIWEGVRVQLEKERRIESSCIRSIHSHLPVRTDKLKKLEDEFSKKMEENNCQRHRRLKELAAEHLAERDEERQKGTTLLNAVKSSVLGESSNDLPSPGSGFGYNVECSQVSKRSTPLGDLGPESSHRDEERGPDDVLHNLQTSGVPPFSNPESVSSEARDVTTPDNTNCMNDKVSATCPEGGSLAGRQQPNEVSTSIDGPENNVGVIQPSENKTPDGSALSVRDQEVSLEIPGNATNEEGVADVAKITIPVESNKEDDGVELNTPNDMQNLGDKGGIPFNDEPFSGEPTLVRSSSSLTVVTAVLGGQSLQNLVPLDGCLESSISAGMQDGDALDSGTHNNPQHVEVSALPQNDTGSTDLVNHEIDFIEPIEQPRSQDGLLSVRAVEYQPCDEIQTSVRSVEAPSQSLEDRAEHSNQAVSSTMGDLAVHPPAGASQSVGLNQPDSSSACRLNHQPTTEGLFPSIGTSRALLEDITGSQTQDCLLPGTSLGTYPPNDISGGGTGSHLFMHTTPQVAPRMLRQPLGADPLQNELDRLRKETEQATKLHEEMTLQLRSECDKEIEEIVDQIRKKYEAKLQDAESAYLLRKKDLDMNHNKVLMNKILADAFKTKCLDLKPSGAPGMQQFMPSSFMQHRQQQSLQSTQRPPPVISSSTIVSHSANQHATVPPVQAVVHHSSAPFPSMPTRPLQIGSITLPAGNTQAREIRAPAPHLQPFRPSTAVPPNISSHSRGTPSQMAPSNMPLPPQLPLLSPPSHHSGLYSRPVRPEITGGSLGLQNSMLSAMNVDSRSVALPRVNLPPLSELGTNFDALDFSEFGVMGNVAVNNSNPAVGTDVVIVLDDD